MSNHPLIKLDHLRFFFNENNETTMTMIMKTMICNNNSKSQVLTLSVTPYVRAQKVIFFLHQYVLLCMLFDLKQCFAP